MRDGVEVFQRAAGRNDPEPPFDACRFADSPLERLGPPRPIYRMNALPELFERGDPLVRIEAVQASVFIRGVGYLSGHAVQRSGTCMREPLRFGKVGLASPQLGGPLSHRGLQHVPGPAKLLFSPGALAGQGGVLKGGRSAIRSQAEQELVDLRGKAHAITGRDNDTALGIDTDGNGNTAAGPGTAVDVGNGLNT